MDEQPRGEDAPGLANDSLGDGQNINPEIVERAGSRPDRDPSESDEEEARGPDVDKLEEDEAYNPSDPMLRRLKGG